MSSAQEPHHLLPPPKPKLSPLELRNTDLVSRLLAATPPYLYNMSLLPNTYFFSEMLRSFVQAKNGENAQRGNVANGFGGNTNMFYGQSVRRSRKRAWNNIGRENVFQNNLMVEEKVEKPVNEKLDSSEPWMIKSMRRNEENALELTTNSENISQKLEDQQRQKPPKLEDPPPHFTTQHESPSNLVLPPPPPIWYPPLYPTPPYGIDPLHFFIDLRVSGHIYDKQNNNLAKEGGSTGPSGGNGANTTIVSPKEDEKLETESKNIKLEDSIGSMFVQKRHSSAFSVPSASSTSKNRLHDRSQTKFDVKSMGFDKSSNSTSTNYIMSNISNIYRNLSDKKPPKRAPGTEESMNIDVDVDVEDPYNKRNLVEDHLTTSNLSRDNSVESEEEKQRKAKDLRALIGLELVVDYMANKKGMEKKQESSFVISEGEEEGSSDVESVGSPQLEVVAVQDDS